MAKDLEKSYQNLKEYIKKEVEANPGLTLASVLIGQDPAAKSYRKSQESLALKLGVKYICLDLAQDISFEDFSLKIQDLNQDKNITGIIINKPLPKSWSQDEVFSLIDKAKDVEGMHPANLGKLFRANVKVLDQLNIESADIILPPTVRSVLEMLNLADSLNLYGKRVVIVGFSSLLGKPLAIFLANCFATVSITHTGTYERGDLADYISEADIVISAVGKPNLIKGEWIKKASIVIDVGTAVEGNKLVGDLEYEKAKEKALFITPVPGGVGKFTSLFLYYNLTLLHFLKNK